ncbi:MAG: zinc ABC transporter substrate-binding protein [Clostridiales bacterium]|nr:zinc ABC transporter substrate-binding protein [Clostridiales bacterium]
MKKFIVFILSAIFFVGIFSGCSLSNDGGGVGEQGETDGLKIVVTVFPEYDWLREIMGEVFSSSKVTFLLSNGVDMHSYQPSANDIIEISTCDIFVYVGGESDSWVEDALKNAENKDIKIINLIEILGDAAKEEEITEGMQAEEELEEENENSSHSLGEANGEGDTASYDEHVWLSLKNAVIFCERISEALQEVDSQNAGTYRENTERYVEELRELDSEFSSSIDNSSKKTLLFGDRFPFRYLIDDYSLSYYAAFPGCSAESEASFETISFLAARLNDLDITTVLTVDGSDGGIAEAIISASGKSDVQILSLDSMQSTTLADAQNGKSYLSIMKDNLDVLKIALS